LISEAHLVEAGLMNGFRCSPASHPNRINPASSRNATTVPCGAHIGNLDCANRSSGECSKLSADPQRTATPTRGLSSCGDLQGYTQGTEDRHTTTNVSNENSRRCLERTGRVERQLDEPDQEFGTEFCRTLFRDPLGLRSQCVMMAIVDATSGEVYGPPLAARVR
jgi:hypothetical protein